MLSILIFNQFYVPKIAKQLKYPKFFPLFKTQKKTKSHNDYKIFFQSINLLLWIILYSTQQRKETSFHRVPLKMMMMSVTIFFVKLYYSRDSIREIKKKKEKTREWEKECILCKVIQNALKEFIVHYSLRAYNFSHEFSP